MAALKKQENTSSLWCSLYSGSIIGDLVELVETTCDTGCSNEETNCYVYSFDMYVMLPRDTCYKYYPRDNLLRTSSTNIKIDHKKKAYCLICDSMLDVYQAGLDVGCLSGGNIFEETTCITCNCPVKECAEKLLEDRKRTLALIYKNNRSHILGVVARHFLGR